MFNSIIKDVKAQKAGSSLFNVIKALLINRSVQMLTLYRLAKKLKKIPLIGNVVSTVVTYVSRLIIPCEISVDSNIEPGVYFPHPLGIVIGEGVNIKGTATIYQNTTFGRKNSEMSSYPTISEGCVIYSGAVIIGEIIIGKNSIVGANSIVNKSVDSNLIVAGAPAKIIKEIVYKI